MRHFGRVLTAMVTPFGPDGSVNYQAAAKLARYLVEHGSDGVVVAGTTGESPTLTLDEKIKLYTTVLEAVGERASVIAGTGSNDTASSITLTQAAEKTGVHGVMAVGPYYNKPTQEGYYQHFKAIAESTSLPVILYNVPSRTGSNIQPATILRLVDGKYIAAVKEASGCLDQAAEIIRRVPDGFMVYSGDDSLTLPILAIGGTGVISVASHLVGGRIQDMIAAYETGQVATARHIHAELFPLFKTMFITSNPIPVKTAMTFLGHETGTFRLPLFPAAAHEVEQIKAVMKTFNLI